MNSASGYSTPFSSDPAKVEARARARATRAAAFAAAPDAGAKMRERFLSELLPVLALPECAVFSGYIPVRQELDVLPLAHALAERGLTGSLPCVEDAGKPLLFRRWQADGPLVAAGFGLSEPPADAPAIEPDLLLVPLLAFDRRGHRLGYGRGFYDRTLAALRARRAIVAVGLAFAAQEMLSVPTGSDDQRLDWIVTERDVIQPNGVV